MFSVVYGHDLLERTINSTIINLSLSLSDHHALILGLRSGFESSDLDRPGRLPHQQGLCESEAGLTSGSGPSTYPENRDFKGHVGGVRSAYTDSEFRMQQALALAG